MTRTFCDRCGSDTTTDPDFSMSLEEFDEDGDPVEKNDFDLCRSCAEIVKLAVKPVARRKR